MSSERWDVTHSHGEFSCPNIRGWLCGWSVIFVRGGPSLSYSWMIGRKIVVQICWIPIVLLFFAFFPVGVTWLLLFSNLFGEVVGGVACFFRVSCQTLRFIVWCKAWNVLFHMCQMMISTRFRFPWRRVLASGVEFPGPSSEGDSWGGVWCPTWWTEIRVKFEGRVRCNNAGIRIIHSSQPASFSNLAEVCMKLGAARLCYFVFRRMIWVHYCSSKGHQRHPLTKPHNPCPLKRGMWPTRMGDFSCPYICKDNTSSDPFSRCKSVQQFGYIWNWRSQNTVWLQVHNWTIKIQKERTLHLVLRLRGETERQDARHQWQRDRQDPEHLPQSAHEPQHVNWCTRDPMCA